MCAGERIDNEGVVCLYDAAVLNGTGDAQPLTVMQVIVLAHPMAAPVADLAALLLTPLTLLF